MQLLISMIALACLVGLTLCLTWALAKLAPGSGPRASFAPTTDAPGTGAPATGTTGAPATGTTGAPVNAVVVVVERPPGASGSGATPPATAGPKPGTVTVPGLSAASLTTTLPAGLGGAGRCPPTGTVVKCGADILVASHGALRQLSPAMYAALGSPAPAAAPASVCSCARGAAITTDAEALSALTVTPMTLVQPGVVGCYPNGTVLRCSDTKDVYYVSQGVLRHVAGAAYQSAGAPLPTAEIPSCGVLSKCAVGRPLVTAADWNAM